jgi:hypothetical protein
MRTTAQFACSEVLSTSALIPRKHVDATEESRAILSVVMPAKGESGIP